VTIGLILGIVVVLAVLAWVVYPLRQAQVNRQQGSGTAETQRLENLLFEREAALLAIRDLQMDRDMNKIGEEDFAEMDARYRAHAIEILKQLDELGVATPAAEPADDSLDAWIERAVAEARQGKRRIGAEGAAEA
jgi:hypothetical protein